jgi:hypothetical protein
MAIKQIKINRWECTCNREQCKALWISATENVPERCNKCNQTNWNKETIRKYTKKVKEIVLL